MSADEDTELRDLVAQTLEANGVLGKIRAQLRASVFLALEEQESVQGKHPFENADLKKFVSTKEGRAIAGLVREFLEFFKLEFTLAVFEPESGLGPESINRESLARELNILETDGPPKGPLLSEVLKGAQSDKGSRKSTIKEHSQSHDEDVIPKELSSKQILDAKQKFEFYDRDRNGEIDKDELRALFVDMFPGFNRNMLDRYVNDEFKATDTDFSSSINFDEFLSMYKRLFLQCRTVISSDVSEIINKRAQSPPSLSKGSNDSRGFVDSKNQKNLLGGNDLRNGPKQAEVDLLGSDIDEDPFFDDPVPQSGGVKTYGNMIETPGETRRATSGRPSQIPVYSPLRSANSSVSSDSGRDPRPSVNGNSNKAASHANPNSSLSSLSGLPTLNQSKGRRTTGMRPGLQRDEKEEENLRAMDREMADLGLDGDFDYDDDFQSSGHSLSNKSPRTISKSEQRSEQNGSIAEEIEEEIEDFSIEADDPGKSGYDDLTTDRTISQTDGFDYMEDIQSPR